MGAAAGRNEECLEDDVFVRYFAGDLGHAEEDEVRAHVGHCDECRAALAGEARQQAASFEASSAAAASTHAPGKKRREPPPSHEPAAGDTIEGRYLVERRIARGGMGIVYAAKDLERGLPVAVKIMTREHANEPASVARFLRETRVVACVNSEHVVKVYDVGTLHNGTPFMATELLVGHDLADRADEKLPVEIAVEWMLQATRGLAAAHAAGIIHRDVKLSNIFVARGRDGEDVVKVLDFGLCKAASPASLGGESMQASLTSADSIMGTPHYMSPEQYVSSRDVSAATDVWAIGVCLYRLLTGRVPFDGANVTNICAKVVRGEFVPARTLREEIPPAIESVLAKCLARDPQDRYHDASELLDALAKASDEGSPPTLDSHRGYVKPAALSTTQPLPRGVHTTSRNVPMPEPARRSSPLLTLALVMAVVLFGIAFVVNRHRARTSATTTATSVAAPAPSPPETSLAPAVTATTTTTTTTASAAPVIEIAESAAPEPRAKAPAPKPVRPPPTRARAAAPAASKDSLYDKY